SSTLVPAGRVRSSEARQASSASSALWIVTTTVGKGPAAPGGGTARAMSAAAVALAQRLERAETLAVLVGEPARLGRVAHHARRDQDDLLRVLLVRGLAAEQPAHHRQPAQARQAVAAVERGIGDQAGQHHRLAALHGRFGGELALV